MKLNEMLIAKGRIIEGESLPAGVLCRGIWPTCNIDQMNANNRIYGADVWEHVRANEDIMGKIKSRTFYGQAEHPAETASDLQLTSHIVTEMYVDKATALDEAAGDYDVVYSKVDILDTPCGRIINTLIEAGCQIGVSTRAEGDLEEAEDDQGNKYQKVIAEAYDYRALDFTADPSTYGTQPQKVQSSLMVAATEGATAKENRLPRAYAQTILESLKFKGKQDKKTLSEAITALKEARECPDNPGCTCAGCGKCSEEEKVKEGDFGGKQAPPFKKKGEKDNDDKDKDSKVNQKENESKLEVGQVIEDVNQVKGTVKAIDEKQVTIELEDGTSLAIETSFLSTENVEVSFADQAPLEDLMTEPEPGLEEEPKPEPESESEPEPELEPGEEEKKFPFEGKVDEDEYDVGWISSDGTNDHVKVKAKSADEASKKAQSEYGAKKIFQVKKLGEVKEYRVGQVVQIKDAEGNTTVVPRAKVAAVGEALGDDGDMYETVEVTGSDDEDKQLWYREDEYQISVLESKEDQKRRQKIQESYDEMVNWMEAYFKRTSKRKRQKLVAKLVDRISDTCDKPLTESKVGSTAKAIRELRIKEASVRAERDEACVLLDGVDEKIKEVTSARDLETRIMIKKLREAKNQDSQVPALCQMLGRRTRDMATIQESLLKVREAHKAKLTAVRAECETTAKKVIIEGYVRLKLSHSGLVLPKSSRTLLESCDTVEEVDQVFGQVKEAIRRGALRSQKVDSITVRRISEASEKDRLSNNIKENVKKLARSM